MRKFFLIAPKSYTGRLERRIACTKYCLSSEEEKKWQRKLLAMEQDSRYFHSSFDRVPKGMKELGSFNGAGQSELTVYRWHDGTIFIDVFGVYEESIDGIEEGFWTHEEPGRYDYVWFALENEPNARFNVGTKRNPYWVQIKKIIKNGFEKTD